MLREDLANKYHLNRDLRELGHGGKSSGENARPSLPVFYIVLFHVFPGHRARVPSSAGPTRCEYVLNIDLYVTVGKTRSLSSNVPWQHSQISQSCLKGCLAAPQ